eukprot:140317-Pyramimonas_sp.AAC.1
MDVSDKLEDPSGLEVSCPEGFHVVGRERFGRLGNSPRLGSRADYIGSVACNTHERHSIAIMTATSLLLLASKHRSWIFFRT